MVRFDSGRDGSMLENLAEEVEAEVLDKCKIENSKREASRHRRPAGVEAGAQKQEIQNTARQAGGGGGRRRDEAKRINIMKI